MIGSQNSLEKCDKTEKTPLKNVTKLKKLP
jgi:hypothetical protein